MKSEPKQTSQEDASDAALLVHQDSAEGSEPVRGSDPAEKASMRECVQAVARERIQITTVQPARQRRLSAIDEPEDETPLPLGVETKPSKRIRRRRQRLVAAALAIVGSGALFAVALHRTRGSPSVNAQPPIPKAPSTAIEQSIPAATAVAVSNHAAAPSAPQVLRSTVVPPERQPTSRAPARATAIAQPAKAGPAPPVEHPESSPQSGIPVTGRTF